MVYFCFTLETPMKISVSDAKGQLTELVRRAEAGEEVVLTRHGHDVVRLAPIQEPIAASARRQVLNEVRAAGAAKAAPGPNAARSQDFLYGDEGLPQ
jgi:prevent-host-death family protein